MSELTESQWQTAHLMARLLVQEKMDKNELKKVMAYLRTCVNGDNGSDRFFKYLQNLVRGGNKIGHSKKTAGYYQSLDEVCVKHLQPFRDTPQIMLDVLGWAGRLMYYYAGSPIGELMNAPMEVNVVSSRQAELAEAAQSMSWSVGDVVAAEVTNIDGNKVTYTLPGQIKLTQKEPKRFGELSIGKAVQVEVMELRDMGLPKKVKMLG
jgi:hypothetical protein